ncbi:MAG TPA: hypothetical protein DCX89_04695 [Saprospirales bacterium]|nr:hypothetical protein [Saprospirales bacterium]HAY71167.1 hypothetical protein [Saprospirales bacterium]
MFFTLNYLPELNWKCPFMVNKVPNQCKFLKKWLINMRNVHLSCFLVQNSCEIALECNKAMMNFEAAPKSLCPLNPY